MHARTLTPPSYLAKDLLHVFITKTTGQVLDKQILDMDFS
jgi:hypothetical protein